MFRRERTGKFGSLINMVEKSFLRDKFEIYDQICTQI